MTRKRFIKKLMGEGIRRNIARTVLANRPKNCSYKEFYYSAVALGFYFQMVEIFEKADKRALGRGSQSILIADEIGPCRSFTHEDISVEIKC